MVDVLHTYAYVASIPRAGWAYDDLDEWSVVAASLQSGLRAAISGLPKSDPDLIAAESGHADKMSACWRIPGYGALSEKSALVTRNKEQADWLRPELDKLGRLYYQRIRHDPVGAAAAYNQATSPTLKAKGACYWLAGSVPDGAAALVNLAGDQPSLQQLHSRHLDATPSWTEPVVTCFERIQASSKARLQRSWVGGLLHESDDYTAYAAPKTRRISAVPYYMNVWATGVAGAMSWAIEDDDSEALAASYDYLFVVAADLTTYDDTVSYETMSLYVELVTTRVVAALVETGVMPNWLGQLVVDIEWDYLTMAIVMPPTSIADDGRRVPTMGRIKSGQKLTSRIGTDINRLRARKKLKELGLVARTFNRGDDLAIMSQDRRLASRYFESGYDDRGFIETQDVDKSFLMRRLQHGYSYLGRMVAACVNREVTHEPRNVVESALGIRVRYELLRGHPLQGSFFGIIESAGGRLAASASVAKSASDQTLMDCVSRIQGSHNAERVAGIMMDAERAGLTPTPAARTMMVEYYSRSQATLAAIQQQALLLGRKRSLETLDPSRRKEEADETSSS